MEPQISIRDVLRWIVENCDDKEAMTKISTMAYPFSSKFQERYPDRVPFRDEDDAGNEKDGGVAVHT